MDNRRFTEPVEEISGTVASASAGGVTLEEYPGRRFQFSASKQIRSTKTKATEVNPRSQNRNLGFADSQHVEFSILW